MSIRLPELRHLSYRWELPTYIKEQCDYYFLDRVNFPQLASEAILTPEGHHIEKHGIKFQIVFQNGALEDYAICIRQEQSGNPCVHKTFWLSYRSISYDWNGEVKTHSIVLVQPARDKKRSMDDRTKELSDFINNAQDNKEKTIRKCIVHGLNYGMGPRPLLTFASAVADSLDKMENEKDTD